MNRSALLGLAVGVAVTVAVGLLLFRTRPAPVAERPAAAEPAAPQPGRWQLVSSVEILMLDTATGELWFYRDGRWRRAAGPPRDDGDRSAVLGELEPPRAEAAPEPPAALPAAAPEERGRAEVIQVESAPERPEKPARRPARRP